MKSLAADPSYLTLKNFIISQTGLNYFADKDDDLCVRLARRMVALGMATCGPYLDLLRAGGPEFDRLTTELTIGETYFMRHEDQFEAVRTHILPQLIAAAQSTRRLRLWCAGCSIGAEPYSLAILLRESFGAALVGWDVRIIATDINVASLKRAAEGIYDDWAFRTTTPDFRARHFTRSGKSWAINAEYKSLVEFKHHNLLSHPWMNSSLSGQFDLITCRNVMIYFDQPTIALVKTHFEAVLAPEGWLVIGHAEALPGGGALELRSLPRVTAYQKHEATPPAPIVVAPLPAPRPKVKPVPITPAKDDEYLRDLANAGEFDEALKFAAESLARHPRNAVAHYYRALIFVQKGRDPEADLIRATTIDPEFIMAHYQLGLAFERRGWSVQAARAFARVETLIANLKDDAALPFGDDVRVGDLRRAVVARGRVAG